LGHIDPGPAGNYDPDGMRDMIYCLRRQRRDDVALRLWKVR
jgi:hypothetical protein